MSATGSLDDDIKRLQIRKLEAELEASKRPPAWPQKALQFLPVLTALIAVCGFLAGIYQFSAAQKAQQKRAAADAKNQQEARQYAATQEFRQAFWLQRLAIYHKAIAAAGALASGETLDAAKRREHEAEFRALYWGQMSLIEDDEVKRAMENFSRTLSQGTATVAGHESTGTSKENFATPTPGNPKPEGNRSADAPMGSQALKDSAYALALACRESLNRTWQEVELDKFPDAPPRDR